MTHMEKQDTEQSLSLPDEPLEELGIQLPIRQLWKVILLDLV